MAKRKGDLPKDLGIPEESLNSLARTLFPIIRDFLLAEEGKKAYEKWENEQLNNSNLNKDLTNI